MASTINASSTGSGGLITTGDASGVLQLQSNGTVALATSDGNIGIGGATPVTVGSLPRAIEFSYGAFTSYNSTEINFSGNGYIDTNGWKYKATGPATLYQQSNGAHTWSSATSGSAGGSLSWTNSMSINNNGQITRPLQPAFSAGGTGSGSKTPGTVFGFTTSGPTSNISINVGGGWSNANSRFTAPVAGVYAFFCSIYVQNSNTNNSSIAPCINGVQLSTGSDTFMGYQGTITNSDNNVLFSFIMNLAANDYVDLRVRTGSVTVSYYGGHSWFQGYLLG